MTPRNPARLRWGEGRNNVMGLAGVITLRRLAEELGNGCEFHRPLWRADVLQDPALLAPAVDEVAGAGSAIPSVQRRLPTLNSTALYAGCRSGAEPDPGPRYLWGTTG
jgi:hypothetical protein